MSRPPRARGLKLAVIDAQELQLHASRPPRARGLKQSHYIFLPFPLASRPPRARGLKLVNYAPPKTLAQVAPPAGAWIETSAIGFSRGLESCRAPRGRVD